jgi:predicted YcjX-like family ATPase
MDFYKIRTSEHRIGVVGLYASGKTVFLTSLINHLKDHDPTRFRLGNGGVVLRRFRELPLDRGWEPFNYKGNRDAVVHAGQWPGKTRDRAQYACAFERSDWWLTQAKLKFYDLPGERIADAYLAVKAYADWCDHILGLLADDKTYRDCAGEFRALLSNPQAAEAELLAAYKLALARLVLAYKPYISPSSFLVNVGGRINRRRDPEAMAADPDFPIGLGPGEEFCPLPASIRSAQPEVRERFTRRYHAYRDQMVLPLMRTIASCHALIILVDVTMLLAGGVGMYDDNRQILLDLLDALDPGESLLGRAVRGAASCVLPHPWRPGRITRIAFVAPKLDQVHQLDQDRMIALLRRMIEKPVRDRIGLVPLFTNCSAVVSTRKFPSDDGERRLLGIPLYDAVTGRRRPPAQVKVEAMQKYLVSELPEEWPASWRPGDYVFPTVYPLVPARKDCPPEQVNLDKILDFVMGSNP